MAIINNIQTLFDRLKIEHIDTYMLQQNWKIIDGDIGDLRIFERELDGITNQTQLLRSNSHPKFRSKLQNFIFSLAVLQTVEPIDVANEIYQVQLPKKASELSATVDRKGSEIQSLSLLNCTTAVINISFDEIWNGSLSIEPDEKLLLFPDLNACSEPEITIHNDGIKLKSTPAGSAKLFQVANLKNCSTLSKIVSNCFEDIALDQSQTQQLEAVTGRANFELSDTKISGENKSSVLKAIAYLMTTVASHLEDQNQHHQKLWEANYEVLGIVGGCIELFPEAKKNFYTIANGDDTNAPSKTLSWLMDHVRNQLR